MTEFQNEVGSWGQVTFPDATNKSIVAHTEEEIREVKECAVYSAPGLPEECADVFLMLLHLAHRNGFDLEAEARKKFESIRNAEWVDDGRGYKKRVKP